jgi:hypothetical protein
MTGNTYHIKNISEHDEAELVFSQARKIKEGEEDAMAEQREADKRAEKRNARGQSLGRLTEVGGDEGEGGEEEGSVKPVAKRRR